MNLGKVIRELRGQRGWSQDELAFKIGTTAANLSRIESDKHGPSSDLLSSIAFVFGIKVYELIALTEGVQIGQVVGAYSAEEEALLRCFRKMRQEERAWFQAIGEAVCRVIRSRGESIRNSGPDSPHRQSKT